MLTVSFLQACRDSSSTRSFLIKYDDLLRATQAPGIWGVKRGTLGHLNHSHLTGVTL